MNEYLTTDELCGFAEEGYEDELWGLIPGYDNYYVSTKGRVWSSKNEKILKPSLDRHGHLYVNLYSNGEVRTVRVHRLMAEQFIPNPNDYPLVRHLNDIKTDNRLENLAWGTKSDNFKDAIQNGRMDNILRPIIAINNDTGVGHYYSSCAEAAKWLGCGYTSVATALETGKNIYGYRIQDADPKYLHDDIQNGEVIRHLFPTQKMRRRPSQSTKVVCTRCEDGERITFNNIIEVVKFFDSPYRTITHAIYKKCKHKGYYIEYDY